MKNDLNNIAQDIRKLTLASIASIGSGHVGGSLSIVDALTAIYFATANIDPKNPRLPSRDRFVLSKGHSGPGLYATLCKRGYFEKDLLLQLNKNGTSLPSHCDMNKIPGVDMTAGSLGQGLSCAVGMALAGAMDRSRYNVYCIIGDGEAQEGQIWEALMFAGANNLNKLIVLVDNNKMQIDGPTDEVCTVNPIKDKLRAFNFRVLEVDGHDPYAIVDAIELAKKSRKKPQAIILDTIKGKGYAPKQGQAASHSVAFTQEEIDRYLSEVKNVR